MKYLYTILITLLALSFSFAQMPDLSAYGVSELGISGNDIQGAASFEGRIRLFDKILDGIIKRLDMTYNRVENVSATPGRSEALEDLREKRAILVKLKEDLKNVKSDEEFASLLQELQRNLDESKKSVKVNASNLAANRIENTSKAFDDAISKLNLLGDKYSSDVEDIKRQYELALSKLNQANDKFSKVKESNNYEELVSNGQKDFREAHLELVKTHKMIKDLVKKYREDLK